MHAVLRTRLAGCCISQLWQHHLGHGLLLCISLLLLEACSSRRAVLHPQVTILPDACQPTLCSSLSAKGRQSLHAQVSFTRPTWACLDRVAYMPASLVVLKAPKVSTYRMLVSGKRVPAVRTACRQSCRQQRSSVSTPRPVSRNAEFKGWGACHQRLAGAACRQQRGIVSPRRIFWAKASLRDQGDASQTS